MTYKFAKFSTSLCVLFSSLLLTSHSAMADGPYLEVKLAAIAPSNIKDATKVGNYSLDFENGYSGSLAVGWATDYLRVEGEINFIGANFDIEDGALDQTLTDGSLKTLMANIYYDLTDDFIITPYIGVGLGYANNSLKDLSEGSHIAAQAMVGAKYELTDNLWIGGEFRHLKSGTDGDLEDFKANSFMATFKIGF